MKAKKTDAQEPATLRTRTILKRKARRTSGPR
jgi:hypothetical protein